MSSKAKRKAPSNSLHGIEDAKKHKSNENDSNSTSVNNDGFLAGVRAFILPAGISKVRCELFKKQLCNNGGEHVTAFDESKLTHVIVDEKMEVERMCKILKKDMPPDPDKISTVKSLWLSSCLKKKEKVSEDEFMLNVRAYIDKIKQKSKAEDTDEENDSKDNAVPSTSSDNINDSAAAGDAAPTCRQVGVMWRAATSKKTGDNSDHDPDSEYSLSGGEEGEKVAFEETPAVNAKGREIPVCL